ncbi:MAG: hypothetical protein JXR83_21995, partial [Deltaproteobacteria bacterium]|nr:hypothetical protein [Deltaproteobacteria bacterium]
MPTADQERSKLPIFIHGFVRFANTNNFVDVYKKSLGRGAVAVYCDAPLEPLKPFEVTIQIAGEPREVRTSAQVVSRRPGMYLLQLLDEQGTARDALEQVARKIQDKLAGDLVENLIRRAEQHARSSPRGAPLPA